MMKNRNTDDDVWQITRAGREDLVPTQKAPLQLFLGAVDEQCKLRLHVDLEARVVLFEKKNRERVA
jgi:hypothetical protein